MKLEHSEMGSDKCSESIVLALWGCWRMHNP